MPFNVAVVTVTTVAVPEITEGAVPGVPPASPPGGGNFQVQCQELK